ncbi:MAG: hypothetical protein WBN30_12665, partial [Polyangiales bacterium]
MKRFFAAAVLALSVGLFGGSPRGFAQDADPSRVTEQGVPDQAVEPEEGVSEVEKAIAQVEEDSEAELPAEFTIKFGDTSDWLRLTSGEWLKGEVHRMREKDIEFDSEKLDL